MELLDYEQDFNLTVNLNEWINAFKSQWINLHTVVELQEDKDKVEGWNYRKFATVLESRAFMSLSMEMVLEQEFIYYMLGPIALRAGSSIEAKAYKFNTLSEAELFMAQLDKTHTALYDFHIETNGTIFVRVASF